MRERENDFDYFSAFGEDCLQEWIKAIMSCLGGFAKPLTSKWFVEKLAPKFPPKSSFGRPP